MPKLDSGSMDLDEMKKMVCAECEHTMTQHKKFKFIYYCDNHLCKFYKTFVTIRGG